MLRVSPSYNGLARALALMGAVLALGTLAGCERGNAKAQRTQTAEPIAVGTYVVTPEQVSLTTDLMGRTSSPMVAEIRPQVGGIIQQRLFTEGALVTAGQVLYQIDPKSYQAAYASAKAEVAKANAALEAARLTAKRQGELAKIDAISQQDNETAQAALKQAEANLAGAKAAEETARIALERTAITAPISGLIDISTVTPGALVTADQATALTTVRQLDPIQVDITESSADLLRLKRNLASGRLQRTDDDAAAVQLVLEDGTTYPRTGTLKFSGVAVNPATGAVTLRALFDNPDGLLLPGMCVRAIPITGVVANALLVPQQAVTRDAAGKTSALVVDADNTVVERNLTIDRAVGNRWLITAGLQPRERVIVEGAQKVTVGDRVQAHDVGVLPAQTLAAAH